MDQFNGYLKVATPETQRARRRRKHRARPDQL